MKVKKTFEGMLLGDAPIARSSKGMGGVAFDRGACAIQISDGRPDLMRRRLSGLLAAQPMGRSGKATMAGGCLCGRTVDRLAGGSRETQTMAVSIHDIVLAG